MTEVWFEADHGTNIGLGHLNRCVSLAKVFQSKKAIVKFLTRSEEAKTFLKNREIATAYDLPQVSHSEMIFVVDKYDFDSFQYKKYKDLGVYVIVIDDLANRKIYCDAYLNHNLFAHRLDLSSISADTFFIGPDYFLVSEQLKNTSLLRNKMSSIAKTILICFGGTDTGQYCLPVLKEISNLNIPNPIVVMTQAPLKIPPHSLKNIDFINKVSCDIENLIIDASLVVCGAGQTSVEAAISGTPFVATILAANQLKNAYILRELGCSVLNKFNPKKIALNCKRALRNNNRYPLILNSGSGLENVVNVAKQACRKNNNTSLARKL